MQMSTMDTETGEMIVKRVSVPIGLEELMEGLTKEILLKKPDDIYLFAAEYFAQLLLLREKGSYKGKPFRTAQSISKQFPKKQPEKLVIRGASKQLLRQISVRGDSPVKRVAPNKKPVVRKDPKEDKTVERTRYTDKTGKIRNSESAVTKNIDSKPKQISRTASESADALNKRDRSVSSSRRGRSVTKSVQGTPRQRNTSSTTPRKGVNENDKPSKPQSKDDAKQETNKNQNKTKQHQSVPKISSVEEDQAFIKDGRLTVTPPKIVKRSQVPESHELINTLVVPQIVEDIASGNQMVPRKTNKEVKDTTSGVADLSEPNKQKTNSEEVKAPKEETDIKMGNAAQINGKKNGVVGETQNKIKANNKEELVDKITNKEFVDNQTENEVINVDQGNDVVDATQNKINADLNSTNSGVDEEIHASLIDEKSTSKSLSNVVDENVNELKNVEVLEKQDDSHSVNTDNTSDDQNTNLLDDISASDILEKDFEDAKSLENGKKLTSIIKESLEQSNSPSETSERGSSSKIVNEGSNLTSTSDGSDTISSAPIKDHQAIIDEKLVVTSSKTQSETVNDTIVSESHKNEEKKGVNKEKIIDDSENEQSSENSKLGIKIKTKNTDSTTTALADVEMEYGDRNIKRDKETEKDEHQDEVKTIRTGQENIALDSNENTTKPDTPIENNIHQNEKDNLKQQTKVDKANIKDTKHPDKGREKIVDDGGNEKSSESSKLDMKVEKKNTAVSSTESSLKDVDVGVHQYDNDRGTKHDKETKKDEHQDKLKTIRTGQEKIALDLKENSTKPDFHSENNHQNKKDNLKQQTKVDKANIKDAKHPDKGIDVDDRRISVHAHVDSDEKDERGHIGDQIAEKNKIASSSIKNESIEKPIPETKSLETNKENDISLFGKYNSVEDNTSNNNTISDAIKSEENKLKDNINKSIENIIPETESTGRTKENHISLIGKDFSVKDKNIEGNKITEGIKSEENKLKNNTNVEIDGNKIGSMKSQMITEEKDMHLKEEKPKEISEHEKKPYNVSEENSDSLDKKQDHDTKTTRHLHDQEEKSENKEVPRTAQTKEAIELKKGTTDKVTKEEEKSNSVADIASTEKKISLKEPDQTYTLTESQAEKVGYEKRNGKDGTLIGPRNDINVKKKELTNAQLIENVENIPMIDKENTKNNMEEHLVDNVENILKTGKENIKDSLKNLEGDNSGSQQEKQVKLTTKLDKIDDKSKDVADTYNGKSTNSITSEGLHLDKISKNVDDEVGDNISDTTKENENVSKETELLADNITKIYTKIHDENNKEKGGEKVNTTENISQENEHTSTSSTNSDASQKHSDNLEIHKQDEHIKITKDPKPASDKNVEHNYGSDESQIDEKTYVIDTSVSKNQSDVVVAKKQQNERSEKETDQNEEAKLSNNQAIDDTNIIKIHDSTEEEKALNRNSDLNIEQKSIKDDDTSSLTDIDKTTKESKRNESEIQIRDDHTESINSVINIAKEGPINNVVKKYIGDFIQQEQQHVFTKNSKQNNSIDNFGQSNEPKEVNENILVKRNDGLTNEGNIELLKDDKPKVDEDIIRNDAMKNVLSSTVLLTETGKVDEILKVHINDFLSNEKNDVFTTEDGTTDTGNNLDEYHHKQIKTHESKNDIKETNHKPEKEDNTKKSVSITRKDSSKNLKPPETHPQKTKQNGKNIKSRSASQATIKVPEDNVKQNSKSKAEKKLRRVKTVDAIIDESKPKPEAKSRIPTADYRSRVKRETDSGKHSVLIKQANSQEPANILPGKAVQKFNKITDSSGENKEDDVVKKDRLSNMTENKPKEDETQQNMEDLKKADQSEPSKSDFDNSKLREELKAVEDETKFATFKPTFNPYILRQEIKNAALLNDPIVDNKEPDNFLAQIAAALKIQAVWRGFKVRKNKAILSQQQKTEPDAIVGNKNSQLVLQGSGDIKGKDITECSNESEGVATETRNEKQGTIQSKSEKDTQNARLNPEQNQSKRVIASPKAEDTKMPLKQENEIKTGEGTEHQLGLQDDVKEKDTNKTDFTTIEKEDDVKTDDNGRKSNLNGITNIGNIKDQHEQLEPQKNLQKVVDHSQVNLNGDSNAVHDNTMNEDTFIKAAVTIQKIWRAFKVRKNIKHAKSRDKDNELLQKNNLNSKIDVKNESGALKLESELRSGNSDFSIEQLAKAAISIQKVWRGFKTRKVINDNQKGKNDLKDKVTDLDKSKSKESPKQNAIDSAQLNTNTLLLNDDKFKKAALIIQKMWRGFNTRKILKQNIAKSNEEKARQVKSEEHLECIEHEVVKKNASANLKSTPEISPELSDPTNYNAFLRAATTIQRVWRGFKVRKTLKADIKQSVSNTDRVNIEHSPNTDITTGKLEVKLENQPDAFQPDNDEFIKAAVKIQKIWRGFKVRKVLKRGDLFGTKVESAKPVVESMKTAEEIHPKDKKSALKIQSLWRGYQVRKNINIIKDKLKEKMTANDESKGMELTDADIMNAATKIQAGVRGYLQRKRYKRGIVNLNSIAEEDVDDNYDTHKNDAVIEPLPLGITNALEEQITSGSKQLSDDEVLKALEDLDKTKIPNHIPLTNEINKQTLNRSLTVQEPEIVKKSSSLLHSVSLGEIKDSKDDTGIQKFKDSNNNSSGKFTSLELEVKEATQNIPETAEHELLPGTAPLNDNLKANTASDSETSKLDLNNESRLVQENRETDIESNRKNNLETESIVDKGNNEIQSVTSDENISYETKNKASGIGKQVTDNHNTKSNSCVSETKSSSNISLPKNPETVKNDSTSNNNHNLHLQISSPNINLDQQTLNQAKHSNTTDPKFNESSEKIEFGNLHTSTRNKQIEASSEYADAIKNSLPNVEQASKTTDEKLRYERPVSVDSTDSAVTVIDNALSSNNEVDFHENESEIKNLPEDTSKEPLLAHENLINDFQNKLLDQISGKNEGEDVNKKFDIEQLRKELEEAGVIYNTNDNVNIQHQNSKEEPNAHDQLFEYLHNLKSAELDDEEPPNITLSPRDLPDIKEEDPEMKSPEEKIALDKTNIDDVPKSKIDIKELQSKLKECQSIAHDINKGIKIIEADPKLIDKESVPSGVENEPKSHENGTDQVDCGTAFCKTPQKKKAEEKYIDGRPLSDHVELLDLNTSSHIVKDVDSLSEKLKSDKPTDLSSTKENGEANSSSGSGLLHTGEMHDTVLASLPSTSDTESQEPDSLENMTTEISTQDDTLSSSSLNPHLLHTGELHDTIVVPLPEKVKNDLKPEMEKHCIAHTVSNNCEQLEKNQIPPPLTTENVVSEDSHPVGSKLTSTGLLHTGELHDSVTVPLSIEAQHILGKTNDQAEKLSLESTKILPSEIVESSQQILSTNESHHEPPAPTGLLHTGELHDTVVVPIHGVGQCTSGVEESEISGNTTRQVDSEISGNTPRQVDSECQTTGEVRAVPIEVQLNQAPGVAVLTSPRPIPAVHGVSSVEDGIAQNPDKGALPLDSAPDFSSPSDIQSMESETSKNATSDNKSMEVEAATKIQAGFRGYQVRKQLKQKNGSSDINNQRRQCRRKSSGRITDNGRIPQNKAKEPKDIEEKSAVKIQAGVRGFLVRRRQKKQKTQES